MIVLLSGSADAALTDLDRLDRLHAEVDGSLDRTRRADWYRADDDGAHIWLDVARCRDIGRAARGDEWVEQYDAMIASAESAGWLDDTGRHVRAHIAQPPSDTSSTTHPTGARRMDLDRRTLNLAAASLSGIASAIALLSALVGRNRGNGAVLPSLLGTIGSAAWAMSALQEIREADGPA